VLTRWGRDLDADNPLPAYPRPQLVRGADSWVNLNGRWQYAFGSESRPGSWDGEIVVPFSPEAELSGVGRQLQPEEWLWYSRTGITAPVGDKVLLHFGAVDQSCTVWVNGTEVGGHTGGYLPFTFDITDALVDGTQCVELRVRDLSETGPHARGKQRLDRGKIWYTAQSGIWQTVWLEAAPETYVERLVITPDLVNEALVITVDASPFVEPVETPVQIRLLSQGQLVAEATGPTNTPIAVPVADPHLWSPDDPFLYDLEITCGGDRVTSYAALRSFGTGTDDAGRRRFLLNGTPFQHVGVLDQGYWSDGLMTAPSDEAMVHDITTMKDLGFTMLRKHAKVEPLRWYHHCDRLGILVWQDMVNGGGRYRELTANLPARWPIRISDSRYNLFFRADQDARAEFRDEVRRTVELLRNVAAIAVWVPFNEGWGQFDANEIAAEVKTLDPTRSVNHTSGWIDQGGGDIKSFHSYLRPFRLRPRKREQRVYALAEYGGYSLVVDGHDWSEEEFGYRHFESAAELGAGFTALHSKQIEPAVRRGLAATVYTQVSDVEDELNGLMTWDREVQKIPTEVVRAALDALRCPRSRAQ
jgi:beta-galactosidase/beta-glucuronidase